MMDGFLKSSLHNLVKNSMETSSLMEKLLTNPSLSGHLIFLGNQNDHSSLAVEPFQWCPTDSILQRQPKKQVANCFRNLRRRK